MPRERLPLDLRAWIEAQKDYIPDGLLSHPQLTVPHFTEDVSCSVCSKHIFRGEWGALKCVAANTGSLIYPVCGRNCQQIGDNLINTYKKGRIKQWKEILEAKRLVKEAREHLQKTRRPRRSVRRRSPILSAV